MKALSTDEVRVIQLRLLDFIDRTCREAGIDYSLGGGSLLGAVRHGGYIPWDDDIDLILARPDYERLIDLLADRLPAGNTALIHYRVRPTYLPMAKVYDTTTLTKSKLDNLNRDTGVFIDLFPMDVLPGDDRVRQAFKKKVVAATHRLSASNPHGIDYASAEHWLYFAAKLILWLPWHLRYRGQTARLARQTDALMQTYAETAEPLAGYAYSAYAGECFAREILEDYEDTAFEQLTVKKIKAHDAYLRGLYGRDYMSPPPADKRRNHHYYHYFWRK